MGTCELVFTAAPFITWSPSIWPARSTSRPSTWQKPMLIYLAHSNANYSSLEDKYVVALRDVGYPQTLYSFVGLAGRQALPITPKTTKPNDDHLPSERTGT